MENYKFYINNKLCVLACIDDNYADNEEYQYICTTQCTAQELIGMINTLQLTVNASLLMLDHNRSNIELMNKINSNQDKELN